MSYSFSERFRRTKLAGGAVILSAAKDLGQIDGQPRFFAALRMTDRTLAT
jgi:hypothetical protein